MKGFWRNIQQCAVLFLLFIVAGYLSIVASYALPEEPIVSHASDSTDFLLGNYIRMDTMWMNWPDYYTDMVMLNIASYSRDDISVFYRAAANEKIGDTFEIVRWLSDRAPIPKQYYSYEGGGADYVVKSYGKYWNGYLIFLRPLLCFLNMHAIYLFSFAFMSIAFFATLVVLLVKDYRFVVPFILAFLTLRPFSKFCLTYAILNLLICGFLIWSACSNKLRHSRRRRLVFFFAMGMVASYFTLMSYSFAIALFSAVYLAFTTPIYETQRELFSRAEELVLMLLWYSAGYCTFWAAKWVVLALISPGQLAEVFKSVMIRVSSNDNGDPITFFEALLWNACGFYYKNTSLFISFGVVLVESILLICHRIHKGMLSVKDWVPELGVIVTIIGSVMIRYAVVLNHSRIHYFFMNRLFSGMVFVILSGETIWLFRCLFVKENMQIQRHSPTK